MRSKLQIFGLIAAVAISVLSCGQPPKTAEANPTVTMREKSAQGPLEFPLGTATPAEGCGACHQAIYREFAYGFGADMKFKDIIYQSQKERHLVLPANVASGATAHAVSGVDPFPIHARDVEEEGRSCNVCHYPEPFAIPPIGNPEIAKPAPRGKGQEEVGITCASCHLTPEGKIRGPHGVHAPHSTVADPSMQSAGMCAYCHSLGKRVSGKQTQTFLEWREDFHNPGLGRQECQDCHMPRTLRKSAEDFDVPARAVSRHLWTGGHSSQRLHTALSLVLLQLEKGQSKLEFHLVNIGAGHSVPTGSNRRGLYLRTEAVNAKGAVVARHEWLFAPWYGDRPDDRKYLEQDNKRKDAVAAKQADAQGPHESSIRAGEERNVAWGPVLKRGKYTIHATLTYDLNRYNDPKFAEDQTTLNRMSLPIEVDQ